MKFIEGIIIAICATAIIASAKAIIDVEILKDDRLDIKTDIRIIKDDIKKILIKVE